MRKVMSGESNVLPNELRYFCKIISRTSSTRSSCLICTRVADWLGRLTHILRCRRVAMSGTLAVKKFLSPDVGGPPVLPPVTGMPVLALSRDRGGASTNVLTMVDSVF